MNFQRIEYPTGIVSNGLKLRYTRMARTAYDPDPATTTYLLDESMTPLVLPAGATIERVRILPPLFAERLPYSTSIGGNPTFEIMRVSLDATVAKAIRTYATEEIGDETFVSQGLITDGLSVDAKKIETGVCVSVLVGSKANPSAGTAEGSLSTTRPIGAAVLQQYDDEGAFSKLASNLVCNFDAIVDGIYDVTVVVEYTIGRDGFTLDDSSWLAG